MVLTGLIWLAFYWTSICIQQKIGRPSLPPLSLSLPHLCFLFLFLFFSFFFFFGWIPTSVFFLLLFGNRIHLTQTKGGKIRFITVTTSCKRIMSNRWSIGHFSTCSITIVVISFICIMTTIPTKLQRQLHVKNVWL